MDCRALSGLLAFLPVVVAGAGTDTYPVKPVRLISPYPPGSSADVTSRLFAPKLTETLGQQFIVDNRPGASGNIGAEAVARAAPDGYTLLTAPASQASSVSLFKHLTFDIARDFEPISMLTNSWHVLAVKPALPVKSVKELIALARARPGQLTYASTGTGGSNHLTMELFRLQAGIDLVHVPYKGSSSAIPDLIGGQVDMMFGSSISVLPHVRSGRLRGLGITSAQRSPAFPELPTISESGLPGFEAGGWSALLAPARTPRAIVARLNAAVSSIVRLPEVIDRLAAQGAVPLGGTPEHAAAFIRSEVVKWSKVIAAAGIRAE